MSDVAQESCRSLNPGNTQGQELLHKLMAMAMPCRQVLEMMSKGRSELLLAQLLELEKQTTFWARELISLSLLSNYTS